MKTTFLAASLLIFFAACSRNDGTYSNQSDRTNYSQDQCETDNEDPDWQITTRVKSALMTDGSLSGSGRMVSVETTNGVVTLTGRVPSRDESRYIENKVKAVRGVRKVNNQLTISQ